MQPGQRRRVGDDTCFVGREPLEPIVDIGARQHTEIARELDVVVVVAGLAREQIAIEIGELAIDGDAVRVGTLERLRERLHPLAAAGLDECTREQRLHGARRLVAGNGRHQRGGVGTRDQSAELAPTAANMADDAFEVLELLARESSERHCELGIRRIAEHETDGSGRRPFLAVRVVEQDLVDMGERAVAPARIGAGGQVQQARHATVFPSMRRRCAIVVLGLVGGCIWRAPTQRHVDMVVPRPEAGVAPAASILAARVSRDASRTPAATDAIVLVFDRDVDAVSLVPQAFLVVEADGTRVFASEAVLAPASESDENRTVTLYGDFGDPKENPATDVVVVSTIYAEDGTPLLGAAAKIEPWDLGARAVVAESITPGPMRSPDARQVLRT
jgi:hypothetical protein